MKHCITLACLLASIVSFGVETEYDISVSSSGAEFSYVSIIAVDSNTYVPWVGGQYVGFSGAAGYNELYASAMYDSSGNLQSSTKYVATTEMDLSGYKNSYFVVEMYNDNGNGGWDYISYTGYSSYDDMLNARSSLKTKPVEGYAYKPLTNSQAYSVPEPTSGLLLLVGGALLGLRRKRRVA